MPQNPKIRVLLEQKVTASGSEPFLVIAGATASGKTELALALAQAVGGEVLSADSRQLYRHLDAGTAKPRRDAQGRVQGIPYHLVDCLEPAETADAGSFALEAREIMKAARARGSMPIVAGGTGLYLKALLHGLDPLPRRDEVLRKSLVEAAAGRGKDFLHRQLAQADPEAALRIAPGNVQRVIRALEVCRLTGKPFSSFLHAARRASAPGDARVFVIEWQPHILRERIERRARALWPGILEEVRALSERYSGQEPGFQSLGYPQAFACLRGELAPSQGLAQLVSLTCAYAKRQRTWFRHQLAARPIAGADTPAMLAELRSLL